VPSPSDLRLSIAEHYRDAELVDAYAELVAGGALGCGSVEGKCAMSNALADAIRGATEYLAVHPEEAKYTDSEAGPARRIADDSESNDYGILGLDESVPAGPLSVTTRVSIAANEVDRETIRELVDWATAHRPVCDAVKRAVPVSVEIVD
jgi:hypothetical protein